MAQTGAAFTEYAALEWRFKRWRGQWNGGIWVTLGHLNPQEITLTGDLLLRGEFEKYYLPDDLQALLNYTGWSVFFQTAQLALSEPCDGHVIPDVVYMGLVDWMLDNADAPLHAEVFAAYWENMEVLQAFFDGVEQQNAALGYTRPDTPVISALAAAAVYSQNSYAMLSFMVWFKEKALWPGFATTLSSFPVLDTLAALSACADVDGDGFSNAEEWLYFDWVTGGALGTAADWEGASFPLFRLMVGLPVLEAGSAVNVPDMTTFANTPGAPPTVTVTIVRGGDGGLVYPPQGTYQLPKYNLTDWWVRNSNGSYSPRPDQCAECDSASAVLQARDDSDWLFKWWQGPPDDSGEYPEGDQVEATYALMGVSMGASQSILLAEVEGEEFWHVTFTHAPGVGEMDLVAEVAAFVEASGAGTVASFLDLSYDRGGMGYTGDMEETYEGDGVPDAAQVALLDAVLREPAYERTMIGGGSSEFIWQDFRDNVQVAQDAMPEADEATCRAVAALLTIGGLGHASHTEKMAAAVAGTAVDLSARKKTARRWLAPDEDLDNDGLSNAEEWAGACALAGENASPEDKLEVYVAEVSDAAPESVTEMQQNIPFMATATQGGDEGEGESDCGCWNDDCNPPARLEIASQSMPPISAQGSVQAPSECEEDVPQLSAGDSVQVGRRIAASAGEGFWVWSAPGTPIHGSAEKSESFLHCTASVVTPINPLNSIEVSYPTKGVEVTFSGASRSVTFGESEGGYGVYSGPAYEKVIVSATKWIFVKIDLGHGESITWPAHLVGWKITNLNGETPSIHDETRRSPTLELIPALVSGIRPVYEIAEPSNDIIRVVDHPVAGSGGCTVLYGHLGPVADLLYKPEGEAAWPHTVAYTGWPDPGFIWKKISMEGAVGRGGVANTVNISTSGRAEFTPAATIKVDITVLNGNGAAKECAGYYTLSPSQKYYTPHIPAENGLPETPSDGVIITAQARKGYSFVEWRGDGEKAIPIQLGDQCAFNRNMMKELPILGWQKIGVLTDDDIQLEAVFDLRRAVIVEGGFLGDSVFPTGAKAPLEKCNYRVETLNQPSEEDLRTWLMTSEILVFNGHGLSSTPGSQWYYYGPGIIYSDDSDPKRSIIPGEVSQMHRHYRLVYMNGCAQAANDWGYEWKNAFDAECFIGWNADATTKACAAFDAKFWEEIGNGSNIGCAFYRACLAKKVLDSTAKPWMRPTICTTRIQDCM